MNIYAELDENNICKNVMMTSHENISPNIIRLNEYDASILGKKYSNGAWEDMPEQEEEPTQLDRIETKLNKNYAEAAETAIDNYTAELVEGGIL